MLWVTGVVFGNSLLSWHNIFGMFKRLVRCLLHRYLDGIAEIDPRYGEYLTLQIDNMNSKLTKPSLLWGFDVRRNWNCIESLLGRFSIYKAAVAYPGMLAGRGTYDPGKIDEGSRGGGPSTLLYHFQIDDRQFSWILKLPITVYFS